MNPTASFTPVTITVETLQVLSKQDKYADLLALYMAYVEITVWQANSSIKATKTFMMKRLHWGEDRLVGAKGKLVELSLIESIVRKDDKGKLSGHYVLVKHIIQSPLKPSAGFHLAQVSEGTSANDYKESANEENKNTHADALKPTVDFGEVEGAKATDKNNIAPVVDETTTEEPDLLALFFKVVKKYNLPPGNRGHYKKWVNELEQAVSKTWALVYLTRLLERDLREERQDDQFVPQINRPYDVLNKSTQIIEYFKRTKDTTTDPRSYE
jgi:hypothetical protein